MRRLLGLKDLIHDVIEKTTDLVEETHQSVFRRQVKMLSFIEPVGDAARVVESASLFTASAVYETIRATNRGIRALEDAGIALARATAIGAGVDQVVSENVEALLKKWPATENGKWLADHAQGALNAAFGDFLSAHKNGLAIEMGLYHEGEPFEATGAALLATFPNATSKICLFVHGLGCTEWAWSFMAEEFHGDRNINFGTLLASDGGYTPVYVRYNTGLHVSENGRKLADLLDALSREYPLGLSEIVIVGHSMGGLVARSAAHYGHEAHAAWADKLTHVFCVGSPHTGAPLEKAGNALASLLAAFETAGTEVPAKILNARSSGIKDLRFGYVVDEDWKGHDPDAFLKDTRSTAPSMSRFIDSVTYCFIGATLTADPNDALGQLVGDVLVRLPSALGMHPEPSRSVRFHFGHVVGGAHHLALMNHPQVYREIVTRLTDRQPRSLPLDAERCEKSSEPICSRPSSSALERTT